MRLIQVISDYIRRSILMNKGDLVVRGDTLPENLPSAVVGRVLKSAGVGEKPTWGKWSISEQGFKLDGFVRSTAGAEVVMGLPFTPKLVIFMAVDSTFANQNFSLGFDEEASRSCIYAYEDMTGNRVATNRSIYIRRDGSNYINGYITAMGEDGFAVTFTLRGVCSTRIRYLAFG